MAVVDVSFFPRHLTHISAFWVFLFDKEIIRKGCYVECTDEALQLAYAAELCGGLGMLHLLSRLKSLISSPEKMPIVIAVDCQSAMHCLINAHKIVMMSAKSHDKVREISSL